MFCFVVHCCGLEIVRGDDHVDRHATPDSLLPPKCMKVSAYCSSCYGRIVGLATQNMRMFSWTFGSSSFANTLLNCCLENASPHRNVLALRDLENYSAVYNGNFLNDSIFEAAFEIALLDAH